MGQSVRWEAADGKLQVIRFCGEFKGGLEVRASRAEGGRRFDAGPARDRRRNGTGATVDRARERAGHQSADVPSGKAPGDAESEADDDEKGDQSGTGATTAFRELDGVLAGP